MTSYCKNFETHQSFLIFLTIRERDLSDVIDKQLKIDFFYSADLKTVIKISKIYLKTILTLVVSERKSPHRISYAHRNYSKLGNILTKKKVSTRKVLSE